MYRYQLVCNTKNALLSQQYCTHISERITLPVSDFFWSTGEHDARIFGSQIRWKTFANLPCRAHAGALLPHQDIGKFI